MLTRSTTADHVSDAFDNDGTQGLVSSDHSLDDDSYPLERVCLSNGATSERRNSDQRFEFRDGSAIVVSGGAAWDIEGPEPWSWAGA